MRHRLDASARGLLVLLQFAHLLDFFSAITALITVQPCLDQAVNPSGVCLDGWRSPNTSGPVKTFFFGSNDQQTDSALAVRGNIAVVFSDGL